jgi:Metal-dependent hydrolases of the beta-lactamase superfamily III
MTKNYLKFWGTRGSCSVSGPEYAEFGGNTCALELRYDDLVLVFDAGTGIRALGQELLRQNVKEIHLFLSHSHWDHFIGIPFFDPIYEPGVHITIWAPPNIRRSYRELVSDLLSPEFFPIRLEQVKADLEFKTIQQKTPISLGDLTLDFHSTHHPGLTYGFKIQTPHQTIGYITDNEMLQGHHGPLHNIPEELSDPHQSLIQFFTGCDLLIHEAQYTPEEYLHKVGWGHSSSLNAMYLIKETKTSQWLVTHHDPSHTDHDLHALQADTKKRLEEYDISCKTAWIGDRFVWPIKKG